MNRDPSIECLDHGIEREHVRCNGWLTHDAGLAESIYPWMLPPSWKSTSMDILKLQIGICGDVFNDRDLSALWGNREC